MGTISARKRGDGTTGHTAQIRIKRGGIVVYTESMTFDREMVARNWLKKRESELAEPGALEAIMNPVEDPPLADAIDKYLNDNKRPVRKTKAQVLRTIKAEKIGKLLCSEVTSQAIIDFLKRLTSLPQTRANYLSHLGAVIRLAKPAWGYPLSEQAYNDAVTVAKHLGLTAKSDQRDRRPTLDELDKLLTFYGTNRSTRKDSIPMQEIVMFALFSTRRQEEITKITFEDLDEAHSDIWVRDMKHPDEKLGNDVRTKLPPPALALILKRRKTPGQKGRIFPHNRNSLSSNFTRACQVLGIEDLCFHDLRHEGITRLFEMGQSIPQVATVSGHRSWATLKRYTHIRTSGDKYAGWIWLEKMGIAPEPDAPEAATELAA